jgi:hypothetical protein
MSEPGYDEHGDPLVKGVISAVGVAVHTQDDSAARIEAAIVAEILKCNEEGIATTEENAWKIRERMAAARQRETEAIEAERNAT